MTLIDRAARRVGLLIRWCCHAGNGFTAWLLSLARRHGPREHPVQSNPAPAGNEQPPTALPAGSHAQSWRAGLPRELGDDLIAVCSELQYLRVWTARGSTLILGALQAVVDAEAGAGMRVHRSWWVHAAHVRSVRRRAGGLFCQLSDGRDIPVSRRRRAEVLARFGDGARYETPAAQNAHTRASDSSNS
jgi:hypothetical protein